MVFTEADWTIETPPASNQPASWDFATTVGQVIGGVWFTWGTDIPPVAASLAGFGALGKRRGQAGLRTANGGLNRGGQCTPSSKPVAPTPAENLAEALRLLQTVQAQIG